MRDVDDGATFEAWLAALDERHLANLTQSEVTRALRALSSCYVERREKLASGGPLDSAGKRAAFALFYAPLHFLVTREIVRGLDAAKGVQRIIDLGCGTGSAGAAYALETGAKMEGVDRNAWAVVEANWTYKALGLRGRATVGTIQRAKLPRAPGVAILAAYTINELPDTDRDVVLRKFAEAHKAGAQVLIVEPIARRMNRWWNHWQDALTAREDEWRFRVSLPPRQKLLAKGAGLDIQELTARTLYVA
jgi:SAM-dependent methyltransferase